MEELGKTRSLKQARRLLEEIALNGHWTASGRNGYAVTWSKGEEKLAIEKYDSEWVIVKHTKGEKNDAAGN